MTKNANTDTKTGCQWQIIVYRDGLLCEINISQNFVDLFLWELRKMLSREKCWVALSENNRELLSCHRVFLNPVTCFKGLAVPPNRTKWWLQCGRVCKRPKDYYQPSKENERNQELSKVHPYVLNSKRITRNCDWTQSYLAELKNINFEDYYANISEELRSAAA